MAAISVVAMAEREHAASLGKRIEALALAPLLLIVTLGVGWLVWCVLEWSKGRTPSYRVLGLRVVRTSDEQPIRLLRSCARSSICLLLVVPTVAVCCVIAFSFVFGASAPEDLLRGPRAAPWDLLTATKVIDEGTRSKGGPGGAHKPLDDIDLTGAPGAPEVHTNGHVRKWE
jgi:hypothetical protein